MAVVDLESNGTLSTEVCRVAHGISQNQVVEWPCGTSRFECSSLFVLYSITLFPEF